MTETQVYWWLMLDSISAVLFFIGAVGAFVSLSVVFYKDDMFGIIFTILFVFIFTLSWFIPSTKQYALMKVIPKLSNSDIAKEVPTDMQDMYKMAKDYLKEKLMAKDYLKEKLVVKK